MTVKLVLLVLSGNRCRCAGGGSDPAIAAHVGGGRPNCSTFPCVSPPLDNDGGLADPPVAAAGPNCLVVLSTTATECRTHRFSTPPSTCPSKATVPSTPLLLAGPVTVSGRRRRSRWRPGVRSGDVADRDGDDAKDEESAAAAAAAAVVDLEPGWYSRWEGDGPAEAGDANSCSRRH